MDQLTERAMTKNLNNYVIENIQRSEARYLQLLERIQTEEEVTSALTRKLEANSEPHHRTPLRRKQKSSVGSSNKSIEEKTVLKLRRKHKRQICAIPGCKKNSQGKSSFCYAHGGGYRCLYPGCNKAARDRSRRCVSHGGGKKCFIHGCNVAARGSSGKCIKHQSMSFLNLCHCGATNNQ
eukprot:snap_masked-scaffold_3-processed-gene-1.32-mRNA-1 protein AED:0.07 eAED:0.07 QI:0/-1/0/1/-1/1/1/0/179